MRPGDPLPKFGGVTAFSCHTFSLSLASLSTREPCRGGNRDDRRHFWRRLPHKENQGGLGGHPNTFRSYFLCTGRRWLNRFLMTSRYVSSLSTLTRYMPRKRGSSVCPWHCTTYWGGDTGDTAALGDVPAPHGTPVPGGSGTAARAHRPRPRSTALSAPASGRPRAAAGGRCLPSAGGFGSETPGGHTGRGQVARSSGTAWGTPPKRPPHTPGSPGRRRRSARGGCGTPGDSIP